MNIKPICVSYNINRKFGYNATEVISIECEEDFKTRYIDVYLYADNVRNTVDISGSTATARMVTTPEYDSLLLSDNVACEVVGTGHIIIPIDSAVIAAYPCDFLVEVHIKNGENVLVLPFPLWVSMRASILDNAGVTPESQGTVPKLLKDATKALEDAEAAIENAGDYDNLENKPSINGVTLDGNKTTEELNIETGGTDDYNELENKPAINGKTISGSKTAGYYGLIDTDTGYTKQELNNILPIETIRSRNILVGSLEVGKIYSTNGRNWNADSGTRTADYTPVEPLTAYTLSRSVIGDAINIFIYDSAENKIDLVGVNANKVSTTFTTPAGTAFVRFYSASDNLNILYQLELGTTVTEYQPPDYSETKLQVSENYMTPETVDRLNYEMIDLYVSSSYSQSDEGYGVTKFNTIYAANESITDNSEKNRYTIHVANGTYTDLQTRYAGVDDNQRPTKDYCGVICKDYVYYEGNVQKPANCIIQWNGKTGFDGDITYSNVSKKSPFHLTNIIGNSLHTYIKGFTFNCENLRYCLHIETGGAGREVDWLIEQCIFNWGGDPDCTDLAGKGSKAAIGAGHSPLEHGAFKNCIINSATGVAYLCHDNSNGTTRDSGVVNGAKIKFQDVDFNNLFIQCINSKGGSIVQVPYILKFINCIDLDEDKITKSYSEGIIVDVWLIEFPDVLTEKEKADIADIVLSELPTTEGVLYGNTSN